MDRRQLRGRESILLAPVGGEQELAVAEFIWFSHLAFLSSLTLPPCHPFSLFPFLCYTWHPHSFHSPILSFPSPSLSVSPQRYSYIECLWSIPHVSRAALTLLQNGGSNEKSGGENKERLFWFRWRVGSVMVSIKGITALVDTSEFDLPPFLKSNLFFLHCIHLNVSRVPQSIFSRMSTHARSLLPS